eukprot:6205733-Pleurochrysis_carterae.AAC.6
MSFVTISYVAWLSLMQIFEFQLAHEPPATLAKDSTDDAISPHSLADTTMEMPSAFSFEASGLVEAGKAPTPHLTLRSCFEFSFHQLQVQSVTLTRQSAESCARRAALACRCLLALPQLEPVQADIEPGHHQQSCRALVIVLHATCLRYVKVVAVDAHAALWSELSRFGGCQSVALWSLSRTVPSMLIMLVISEHH